MRLAAVFIFGSMTCFALGQYPGPASQMSGASSAGSGPPTITLREAIDRAKANSPVFQQALVAFGIAQQDGLQSRAAMLPSLAYNNQYLYTEGNHTPTGVFIANNAVHEYLNQADAHEVFSAAQFAGYRRAMAATALARAKKEIATRGLVVTVVQDYSSLIAAQHQFATAQETAAAAQEFLTITQELEQGREVAQADVIEAQIQFQDRKVDVSKAQLAMEQARLQLALLLFPNFNQEFQVVDNLETPVALPTREEALQMARTDNPNLNAALAETQVAAQELNVARAAYIPGITLDYFYGIDATHFATETREIQNLGYSAQATLNFPIWN
jgi:outer membrane protein TolC